MIKRIPESSDRIQELIHQLIENSDEEGKLKWCRTLAEYEYSFFNLSPDDLDKELANIGLVFPEMRINMYYQANRFFLEDHQILNNIESIKHIPITIIHGKNDLICPPESAINFHNCLLNAKLILVDAGHLSNETKIKQSLLEAVNLW